MDRQPDLNELQPLARVIAEKIRTVPVRHCAGGTEDLIAALTLAVAIYVSREVLPPGPPAATIPASAPTEFELRGTGEIRAAMLVEAANFLRDAHFDEGLTVQEIGTAMRHWADRERGRRADEQPS